MSTKAAPGRRETSWVLRLGLIMAGIGVLLIVVAVIVYMADRATRNAPLSVVTYPDAQLVATAPLGEGHDRVRYISPSPAEEVGTFYQRELGEESCRRFENSAQDANQPTFQYRCYVDRSSLFVTQVTIITIQPGVGEYAGQTLIDMERTWGQ